MEKTQSILLHERKHYSDFIFGILIGETMFNNIKIFNID